MRLFCVKDTNGRHGVDTCIDDTSDDIKIVVETITDKGVHDVFGGSMPAATLYSRVDFIVPATDTYRVVVHNRGPGMAHSCRVNIEQP